MPHLVDLTSSMLRKLFPVNGNISNFPLCTRQYHVQCCTSRNQVMAVRSATCCTRQYHKQTPANTGYRPSISPIVQPRLQELSSFLRSRTHDLSPLPMTSRRMSHLHTSLSASTSAPCNKGQLSDTDTSEPDNDDPIKRIFKSEILAKFLDDIEAGITPYWGVSEWEEFRRKLLRESPHVENMWEGWCMNILKEAPDDSTHMGQSLLEFIRTYKDDANLGTLSAFISLASYVDDHDELLCDAYDRFMIASDQLLIGQVIHGLGRTHRWREAVPHLAAMADIGSSEALAHLYSSIITGAFKYNDVQTGLEMLRQMGTSCLTPDDRSILQYLLYCQNNSDMKHENNTPDIDLLLDLYMKFDWIPSESIATAMADVFRICGWSVSKCVVDKRRRCEHCGSPVHPLVWSEQELSKLRDIFFERTVTSDDIFLVSNPEELRRYKHQLAQRGPFDVVVDVLNVVMHCPPQVVGLKKLEKIINHFLRANHNILLLARIHAKRWPQKLTSVYNHPNVHWFFTDNTSIDDLFMMYAALHSGKNSFFVSRDEMRDHKFKLGPEFAHLFTKWQRARQITLWKRGDHISPTQPPVINLVYPASHDTVVQRSGDGWHIPHEDNADQASYERSNKWLCVRKH